MFVCRRFSCFGGGVDLAGVLFIRLSVVTEANKIRLIFKVGRVYFGERLFF